MTFTLDQSFVDDFLTLTATRDHPELFIAALPVDLAWHREQAEQDQRNRWISLTHRQLLTAHCSPHASLADRQTISWPQSPPQIGAPGIEASPLQLQPAGRC